MSNFEKPDIEIAAATGFDSHSQELTRALRSRRNALTPLCRLPIDLLGRILTVLVCLGHQPYDIALRPRFVLHPMGRWTIYPPPPREPHGQDPVAWTSIAQVCAHIRRIVLESPLLWRYVDFGSPQWADLWIYRSDPVSISATIQHRFDEADFHKAVLVEHRIQHLSINAWYRHSHSMVRYFLRSRLASLASLQIRDMDCLYRLDHHFLNGQASMLKWLSLSNLWLEDITAKFPALTHLDLAYVAMDVHFNTLFTLLRNTPIVSNLTVVNILPPSPHSTYQDSPIILQTPLALPHLSNVYLCDKIDNLHRILEKIPDPRLGLHVLPVFQGPADIALRPPWIQMIDRVLYVAHQNQRTPIFAVVKRPTPKYTVRRMGHLYTTIMPRTSEGREQEDVLFQCRSKLDGAIRTLRTVSHIEIEPYVLRCLGTDPMHWGGCNLATLPALQHLVLLDAQYHILDNYEPLVEYGGSMTWMKANISWLQRRSDAACRVRILELRGGEVHADIIVAFTQLIKASGAVDEGKLRLDR
jgi:hypothetical protein